VAAAPVATRTGFAEVRGARHYYQIVGDLKSGKTPLLVLHGSFMSADAMAPRCSGLRPWGEDPGLSVNKVRPLFGEPALANVQLRDDYAMLGRKSGTGHEPDLEWVLPAPPIEKSMVSAPACAFAS
jgi:hypothetical protein